MTNYKEILELAINNEVEAFEFYTEAQKKSKDENMKAIFGELAEEEMKHKRTLEGFLQNSDLEMNFKPDMPDYKISEAVELPELTTEMTFSDGVALAMKKEQEAMEMYLHFANASNNEKQKQTFIELSKMEKGHKVKLEELYNNSAYNEVW